MFYLFLAITFMSLNSTYEYLHLCLYFQKANVVVSKSLEKNAYLKFHYFKVEIDEIPSYLIIFIVKNILE